MKKCLKFLVAMVLAGAPFAQANDRALQKKIFVGCVSMVSVWRLCNAYGHYQNKRSLELDTSEGNNVKNLMNIKKIAQERSEMYTALRDSAAWFCLAGRLMHPVFKLPSALCIPMAWDHFWRKGKLLTDLLNAREVQRLREESGSHSQLKQKIEDKGSRLPEFVCQAIFIGLWVSFLAVGAIDLIFQIEAVYDGNMGWDFRIPRK
jgi:hypothetical protein